MMDLRELKTFRAVVKHLNFNRAADELCYAQSTVSAQIKALEEELGVRLFDRLGRKVLLTEAGARLLHYADKFLDLAEEATAEVAGMNQAKGSLIIRVPESLLVYRLPSTIQHFRDLCPEVRLNFTNCTHAGLGEDLRKGVTDIAFLLTDFFGAPDLKVENVGSEQLVIIAPRGHRLSSITEIHAEDFTGETILLSRADCSYRIGFERFLTKEGVRLGTRHEFQSMAAIKQCVMAGLGLTIIPRIAVEPELRDGTLTILPLLDSPQEVREVNTYMIRHRDKWVSPSLKSLMSTVRDMLTKQ